MIEVTEKSCRERDTTLASSFPAVAPEVLSFAAEQQVLPFFEPVLGLTRRIFPARPITVGVEEDPEIANERHILIDVDATGLDSDQMFQSQELWFQDIFKHCPATHVCVFRLGMLDRA